MLGKRILGGIIITLAGIFLLVGGEWIFSIGISLILAVAIWEYIGMFRKGGYSPDYPIATIGTFLTALLSKFDWWYFAAPGLILTLFAIIISKFVYQQKIQTSTAIDLAIELSALMFITIPGLFIIQLRMLPNGLYWILISIVPACVGDIGAYACGSLFGKHALAPSISPNKTIEGYIGGVLSASLSGLLLHVILISWLPAISLATSIIVGFLVGLVSPLGDLGKSIMKRAFSLDDTSNLIPGHGGILDRIDTWLWAAPVGFFLATLFLN